MATFTNQARLTYTGGSAASNITVGELVQVLTAAKTAVVPAYRRDGAGCGSLAAVIALSPQKDEK